jgi:hypothetical protein
MAVKRILLFAISLACLPVLLTGCGSKVGAPLQEAPADSGIEAGGLPQEAPADFAICFSYWFDSNRANIYDTYNKIIQKDLVLNGTADADLTVTSKTLNAIYREITELEVYKINEAMISSNLSTSDVRIDVLPNTEYKISFTINGTSFTVTGDATAWEYRDENASAAHFCAFADYMRDVYLNTEEYKALPEAEGGYD